MYIKQASTKLGKGKKSRYESMIGRHHHVSMTIMIVMFVIAIIMMVTMMMITMMMIIIVFLVIMRLSYERITLLFTIK